MKIDINGEQLLSGMNNFNDIFRKVVSCDNIKSHKNQGFTLFQEGTFWEKNTGGLNWPPLSPSLSVVNI